MPSLKAPPATLRLRLDKDALASNWRALDALSGGASAGAAIKANCYGLGINECLPVLRDAGAQEFFVAHWSEVEAAAKHVRPCDIAVLHGPSSDADVAYARATGAMPVINSIEQARRWNKGAVAGKQHQCHVMVDTGMNRLGLSLSELGNEAVQLLHCDTLMSHLASADEDCAMNAEQLAKFREAQTLIDWHSLSLANSAGIALGSEYHFDLTRPGLALYGGIARPELLSAIRQVAYPEVAIIQTRFLKAGDTVGYNAQFTAPTDMQAGVVSLGYADGFLRARGTGGHGEGGHMLHGEKPLSILGKVSMDMIVIDLTNAPDLKEGDWVTVPFELENAAQQSGLSQYELLTTIGARFGTRSGQV